MRFPINRREFLRGSLAGAAVTVGLPYLDIFLNANGTALASGAPLPRRFGTWFFGCGMNPDRWAPTREGPDFELPPELAPIAPVREHLSVLSGFSVLLAGEANQVHYTGIVGTLTGEAPARMDAADLPTFDVLIADQIGTATRFRSLEMTATGRPEHSYSRRNATSLNPSEPSPLALYNRVFGPGFADPNAAEFTPDPRVLLRRSALSVVAEDRRRMEAQVGAADRARLDQYFTSLRQLERQLELSLTKPPPLEACRVPEAPPELADSFEVEQVVESHRLMSQVLAMALACDQTRVFNMVFSDAASSLHTAGSSDSHHTLTHEEPNDPELGYQPRATAFVMRTMEAWTEFVQALAAVPEGDGTLLDNCLVMCHSESSDANTHSVSGLPVILAGRAGGRVKPGVHVRGIGESTARVALTMQQVMGLPVASFGVRQNQTSRPVSEVLA